MNEAKIVEQGKISNNSKKFWQIGIISCLVIFIIIITLGGICYSKHKKNSPEYILRVFGKAFVTGEEKYISAVEEKLDTDAVAKEVLEHLKFDCAIAKHPGKPQNMSDKEMVEFTKDFLIISDEVDNLLLQLKKVASYEYEKEKIWPAVIENIEYVTRNFSGSPKQVAIASIKTQSGLVFKVSLTKENNVWTPYSINGKENICQWLTQIEKYARTNKITFEDASFLFTAQAIQIGPEGLAEFNKTVNTKKR